MYRNQKGRALEKMMRKTESSQSLTRRRVEFQRKNENKVQKKYVFGLELSSMFTDNIVVEKRKLLFIFASKRACLST